jgi:hypothetical protein
MRDVETVIARKAFGFGECDIDESPAGDCWWVNGRSGAIGFPLPVGDEKFIPAEAIDACLSVIGCRPKSFWGTVEGFEKGNLK